MKYLCCFVFCLIAVTSNCVQETSAQVFGGKWTEKNRVYHQIGLLRNIGREFVKPSLGQRLALSEAYSNFSMEWDRHREQIELERKEQHSRARMAELEKDYQDFLDELILKMEEKLKEVYSKQQYEKLNAYRIQKPIERFGFSATLVRNDNLRILGVPKAQRDKVIEKVNKHQKRKEQEYRALKEKYHEEFLRKLPKKAREKARSILQLDLKRK